MGRENAIWKAYPSGKQYLAFPESKEGREYLNTFTRRRDGLRSWQMAEVFAILLIKISIMGDRSANTKKEFKIADKSSILRDAEVYFKIRYSQ